MTLRRHLLTFCLSLTAACASADTRLGSLYQLLDSLLDNQEPLTAAKQSRIEGITHGLQGISLTEDQRYTINQRLYDEYVAFRFDSALFYIQQNVEIARREADPERNAESVTRLSHILSVSGLFDRASTMLGEIRPEQLSAEGKVGYYNQQNELQLYRSEMAVGTPYFSLYIDSAQHFRQQLLDVATKGSYDYIFTLATYVCEKGDVGQAIRLLSDLLPKVEEGSRRYSIVTSTLAYFHSKAGHPEEYERYLLLSAINDELGAIRENNSLRLLAELLFDRGENDRAYHYLLSASSEAKFYGSRLRSLQTARLAPLITEIYNRQRDAVQKRTYQFLAAISVIALLLVATMAFTLSLLRKRRISNERIRQMNEALGQKNEEIQAANEQMKESNLIKDEYIGRFLELSSNLIYRGEERYRQFNRLARDRKLEELYAELKSQKYVAESIRLFHTNFDTAFLNIYPNFVGEVNKLMAEGNAFEVPEGSGRLTTELRVLALLRLGISDNQAIADILRSSLSTIYTYRSRLKSRATNRDTFEDDVRRIATY